MTSTKRLVTPGEIRLGEPLEVSVFDENGLLLLRVGQIVQSQRQLDTLLDCGLYFMSTEGHKPARSIPLPQKVMTPFEVIDLQKTRLQRVFSQYRAGQVQEEFVKIITSIAHAVQEASERDADAALANLHLDYDTSYAVIHHIQAALLCELVGARIGAKSRTRLTLVKAALTHDLALLDIQDELNRQTTPLTEAQHQRITAHPADTTEILTALGVTEPDWLEAVRDHHERLDGSGYPAQRAGAVLRAPARLLAVADIYSAMVRDRPYRRALVSQSAMRQLLLDQAKTMDPQLIHLMIKEIGVFPPGTIVRLANGEVGVVTLRQASRATPIVYAFISHTGLPMMSPQRRDTANPSHAIEGMLPFSDYRPYSAVIRALWRDPI